MYLPGQTTQLIVGATPETDLKIMKLSESLYQNLKLKRVYYSAYVSINQDSNLPTLSSPPLLRKIGYIKLIGYFVFMVLK